MEIEGVSGERGLWSRPRGSNLQGVLLVAPFMEQRLSLPLAPTPFFPGFLWHSSRWGPLETPLCGWELADNYPTFLAPGGGGDLVQVIFWKVCGGVWDCASQTSSLGPAVPRTTI